MSDRMIYSVKLNFKEGLMTKEEKKTIKAENKERNRELKEFLNKPENKKVKKYVRSSGFWIAGAALASVITGGALSDLIYDAAGTKEEHIIKVYNEAIKFEKERLAKGDITQEEFNENVEELEKECQKKLKKNSIFSTVKVLGTSAFCGMTGAVIVDTIMDATDIVVKRAMEEAKSTSKNKTKAQQDEIIKNFIKGKKNE